MTNLLENTGLTYILRGIKGEYYICEEEIFKESYEEVHD